MRFDQSHFLQGFRSLVETAMAAREQYSAEPLDVATPRATGIAVGSRLRR
jgi:hypothetical protein